jgi:hypothetical protein
VRQTAADRASIADLQVADPLGGFGDEGKSSADEVGLEHLAVTG